MIRRVSRLTIGILIVCIVMVAGGHSVQAGRDAVSEIDQLAADLHRQDVGSGNATVWHGGSLGKAPKIMPQNLTVGEPIPEFSLKKFGTVQSVRSDGLTGPYLLNIWASWCPPCRNEFPRLVKADRAGNLPFTIYYVNSGDMQRRANTFLRQQPPKLNILFDPPPSYDFGSLIGQQVFPSSILVGEDGTVLAVHAGEITDLALQFLEAVARNPGQGTYHPSGMLPPVKPFNTESALPLVPGYEHYAALDDSRPYVAYSFDGKKGSVVTISMRATGQTADDYVDPYLVLLDSKGKVIAYDDDGGAFESSVHDSRGNDLAGSDVDALIDHVKLPGTGTYTIIASRAGYEAGMNQGGYQLILINEKTAF